MKIALIAPPYPLEEIPSPPMGLTCIAAACEAAGAEVIIFDYIVRGFSEASLRQEIEAFGPEIIGTNSVTLNVKQAAGILAMAKRIAPDAVTVMGGPHVSFDSDAVLETWPDIDIIVRGEGERTITELMEVIHQKDQWHSVHGIVFREGGRHVTTPSRELIEDLDSLTVPARHLLPLSRYQALGFPVSIITSRGCPNHCIFCLGRRMVGSRVRYRSPEKIADELEMLKDMGFTFVNFADDLFTADRERVHAVCSEMIRRDLGISWSAFSRVNTIDAETLTVMKEAGCHSVSFGIESGNPEMLKRVKKGITLNQARKAAAACRQAGVRGHASFIVGLPGENQETLNQTLAFQKELGIEYGYHFLTPFPGTTVREENRKYDLEILTHDWDRYDANSAVVRTSALPPEEMEAFVRKAYEPLSNEWETIRQRYENGSADDNETMRVAGHYRMKLVFDLLSGNLLENLAPVQEDTNDALTTLTGTLAQLTGSDPDLTRDTVTDLICRGYIRKQMEKEGLTLSWTPIVKKALT